MNSSGPGLPMPVSVAVASQGLAAAQGAAQAAICSARAFRR
ncbi:MAG TPA: hypothetical protein PKB14_17300 [Rubrivivax sp.]|nr:hypothetical protein [Rubrivivax sp.]